MKRCLRSRDGERRRQCRVGIVLQLDSEESKKAKRDGESDYELPSEPHYAAAT